MKTLYPNYIMKTIKIAMLLLLFTNVGIAQTSEGHQLRLTLQEAIQKAKLNNKQVMSSKFEQQAAAEDLKDANASVLPNIGANGSYQRFTKLTLYTDGLGGHHSIPKNPGPDGADLSLSASFNLYSGGKTRSVQEEQLHKTSLAEVNMSETSSNISLQVAAQYLDLIRLSAQRKLILDQVKRAEARLKNIDALYRNQKVTRSDVLRAEVMLSNVQLNLQQIQNDITITNQKLNVLLDISDSSVIVPVDSLNSHSLSISETKSLVSLAPAASFGILKYDENLKVQQARIKGVKSNFYPSVSVYSAYGINYPNTLFVPPVDQAYSIGFVGLKVQYNLSSLYHNKHKVSSGNARLQQLQKQKEALADNIAQEAESLSVKYQEALNRIGVIEKQIEQASVNYKIVSAKYFNQLALLTDLLDADNLYQESRYNLVQAQATHQLLSYRLQYISGKL